MAEAISLAKKLNDLHALAVAIFWASVLSYYEHDPVKVERCASDLTELATHHILGIGRLAERYSAVGRAAPWVTRCVHLLD
jgi:hypothetical protein